MHSDWNRNHSGGFRAKSRCLLLTLAGLMSPFFVSTPILAMPISTSGPQVITESSATLSPELQTLLRKAAASLLKSRYEEAETLTLKVLKREPGSPDAWQILGYALANLERYDEAIDALDKAAVRYIDNVDPLITRGEIQLYLGRQEEALSAFEQALKQEPSNKRALENLTKIARQTGNLKVAITYYERAIQNLSRDGDELGLKPELAALYLSVDQPKAAQKLLARWANIPQGTPDNVIGLLALAAAKLDNHVLVIRYLEARISHYPTPTAYIDLAKFHRGRLDFVASERVLKKAIAEFPRSSLTWYELGRTYGGEGRYTAARDAFKKGLQVAPESRSLLKGASLAELRLGRLDAALALATKLALRKGSVAGDYIWLGSIEEARGNTPAAIDAYETAIKIEQTNWVAHNNLASVLSEQDPGRAVSHARTAESLTGGAYAVRDTLGWALFKNGDLLDASKVFAKLVNEAPENPNSAYRYGRVLIELGKTTEGRAELQRALKLDPSFSYAEDARQRLAK